MDAQQRVVGGHEVTVREIGPADLGPADLGPADLGPADLGPPVPTVVLVHGIGVSSRYFSRLVKALSRHAVVVVPDLVGFGGSPRAAEPLTITEHADVVAGLLDQLAEDRAAADATHTSAALAAPDTRRRPATATDPHPGPPVPMLLVGHSMGAQVVTELAIRRPDLCSGLMLLGPVVDPAAPSPPRQGLRLVRDAFREPPSGLAVQVREWLRTGVRWYLRTATAMCEYRLEERLPLVEQPVTLVRGAKDPVTPSSFLRELARSLPDADVVEVPGAAHLVMWSRADEVAALCESRLQERW